VSTDASRLSAYADLVAAVLDLRSSAAREAFDEALAKARASGEIADDLARQLRWLQRQSERALVEHAESVLPPALVALDQSATDAQAAPADHLPTARPASPPPTTPDSATDEPADELPDELPDDEPAAVVNLQSRRLLVAGLRPITDSTHRGVLPFVPADPGL
jgi:hypothetical protein